MEKTKRQNKSYFIETLKALIIALIISLVLVLASAFVINIFNFSPNVTVYVNQVIKGVSILIAALICFRLPKNGWVRGIVFGLLYTALTFVVFSLLDDMTFNFGRNLLNDIALGTLSGLISGIIAVNVHRKN